MKRFKNQTNKSGFMFVEVILAVAIMGISSIALFSLQSSVVNLVWRENSYAEHVLKLRNFFFDPKNQKIISSEYQGARIIEQKNSQGFTELKYEIIPVSSKSDLHRRFPDIYIASANGSWQGIYEKLEEDIIGLVHILPVEEQE